ncbi:MAG: phosphoribosyl-AMP cyclohydrolase [Patescibacteria group bacterium]
MLEKERMLEDGAKLMIDWEKIKNVVNSNVGVVPVVVQDNNSREVLMMGYVNQEAFEYSLKNKVASFWSTSRNIFWVKGETSGNYFKLIDVRINCEQNSLLYLVETADGFGACHSKDKNGKYRKTCFYQRIVGINDLFLNFVNDDEDELHLLYEGGEGHG